MSEVSSNPTATPSTALSESPAPAAQPFQSVSITCIKEDRILFASGGDNLRQKVLENGVDLYKLVGKMMNCGGYGQCGTCIVDVVDGLENLSARTPVEDRKLKNKPASYRLACQCLVQGPVSINTKP